ncbi:MAG: hypothetical protein H5U03_02280, partial [Clostridia bacterium]|nr:hypothetical protein [Clostridia bacterium]
MVSARCWLLSFVVLFLVSAGGLAESNSADWKTLQAGDLCLRFPDDWFDITPLIDFVLPELVADEELEGVEFSAAIMRFPPTPAAEPAILLVLFAEEETFTPQLLLPELEGELLERAEGVVAGEPGVYEQYELQDPEGVAWLAYTLQPRPDGRYVLVLALVPTATPVPQEVIREMLLSVAPCPPPTLEERVVALENGLQELKRAYEVKIKALEERIIALEATIAALRAERKLKVGIIDAENLFTRVFLLQVAAERSVLQAKGQAIQDLQEKYSQGQINADAYQQEYAKLQAEYLQAQVQVNMSMLEKMIASPGF